MAIKDTLAKAEQFLDEFSFSKDFLDKLGLNVAQATKRVYIDQIKAQAGNIKGVDVEKVEMGTANIQRIEINNMSANLQSGQAFMRNVRSILELDFTLEWEIDLGFIGSWDGSNSLGSIDIPFNVGDITIPDLNDIEMNIPSVTVPGIKAKMAPITNLTLGETKLKQIEVNDTTLPAAGFNLTGMGVGSMSINDVQVPGTDTVKASIQKVTPTEKIVLPEANLQDLEIPATQVPDITSPSFSTTAVASSRSLTADIGILAVTLKINPTIHLDVESLTISDVELSAMAEEIKLQNMAVPVSMNGVSVREIDLDNIKIHQVTL